MENKIEKRKFSQWFFGDYSWTLKVMWVTSFFVIVTIAMDSEKSLWGLIVEGDFNSAYLLVIIGYLSELRYKFIEESRND